MTTNQCKSRRYLVSALEDGRKLPAPLFPGLDHRDWLREIKPGYQQLTELLDELADLEFLEQSPAID